MRRSCISGPADCTAWEVVVLGVTNATVKASAASSEGMRRLHDGTFELQAHVCSGKDAAGVLISVTEQWIDSRTCLHLIQTTGLQMLDCQYHLHDNIIRATMRPH